MEENVTILSVKSYSFDKDGSKLEGCTVHFYPSDSFESVVDDSIHLLGLQPSKCTMPFEFYETAKKVGIPCQATVRYVIRQVQGEKVLKVDSINFIK